MFFSKHDYERSSLDEIAQALGVTKGAIYHHFKNKDELFKEAVQMLFSFLIEFMVDALKRVTTFEEYLKNMFKIDDLVGEMGEATGIASTLGDYENIMYMFLTGIKKFPELKEELSDIYKRFINELIVIMNRAAFAGEIRKDADFEAIAYQITAYYEGTILLGSITGNMQFTGLGPRVCEEIWKGLALNNEEDKQK